MRRTYDKGSQRAIKQLFRNAIKAVNQGLICDPGDLGIVANELESLVGELAEKGFEDPEDAVVWFQSPAESTVPELIALLEEGVWETVEAVA